MIIIKILGGFANQLFQYALYEEMKERGKEVYLDTDLLSSDLYRNVARFSIFPVDYQEASRKQKKILLDNGKSIFSLVRRKLYGSRAKVFNEDYNLHFQSEIFDLDDAYITGFWQCEKYFESVRERIQNLFSFEHLIDDKNKAFSERMKQENSVSIHIRRGDYLVGRAKQLYGGVCTEDYYNKAVRYITERYENPRFYVFTNDIQWVTENFSIPNMTIVDWNQGNDDFKDMFLMSQCRYNIIANSSFSWWGAWLNNYVCKEVVCPNDWFNLEFHDAPHIQCKDWKRIT